MTHLPASILDEIAAPEGDLHLRELMLMVKVAEAADAYIWAVNPPLTAATGPWPDLVDAVYALRRHRHRHPERA